MKFGLPCRLSFVLAIIIAFSIVSCTKSAIPEPPATEYYFRCKIDGTLKDFKIPDSAFLTNTLVNGVYSFGAGAVDDVTSLNSMSIYINDFTSTTIKQGIVYKADFTPSSGITKIQAWINYSDLLGNSNSSTLTPGLYGPAPESAEIILTEITDAYLKGVFKGNLLVDEITSNAIKFRVTEGEFYLPRSKSQRSGPAPDGDGFMEGTLLGKSLSIKESDDYLNDVYARFEIGDNPDGKGGKIYRLSIDAVSNILLSDYRAISLLFTNTSAFKEGSFALAYDPNNLLVSPFGGSVQYKENNNLKTYSGLIGVSTGGDASLQLTKYSEKPGDYIEGSYTINNAFYLGGITGPYSLTSGKFRAKVKK